MTAAHANEPETISLIALADRFMETHRTIKNRAFAFVLGAGASRSSGIKSAGEMVSDWVRLLHREAGFDGEGDGKNWATAATLKISKYDPNDPAASYSELYRRMYRNDPDRGYAYLEEQMRSAEPSYGYSVLARIMEDHQHKVVVTTNFDNLVADSLSIFSKTYPLVCGHESLAGFISARVRRPVVVKVHRDLLLAPRSTPEDLTDLPNEFTKALAELFRHYTPIVIGYGGNDGSLMKFLKGLQPRSVPGGVYWCYWEGGHSPSTEIRDFVSNQCGSLVPIPGFDEAMMLIGNQLEFGPPDKFVLDRAEARVKRIVMQSRELAARLSKKKESTVPSANSDEQVMSAEIGSKIVLPPKPTKQTAKPHQPTETASAVASELSKAAKATMQRTSGALRWWQWDERAQAEPNFEKRDKIYQDAITALPDSSELQFSYAIFLENVLKDNDRAEEYYTKALSIEPDDVDILYSYANFLTAIREEHDKAEEYYKKALSIEPDDVDVLTNYANFLKDVRKEYNTAEEYYKKALSIEPDDVDILGNYANVLKDAHKDHDKAEEYYKKALSIEPDDAITLGNYANFLLSFERVDEGLEILQRAIAALDESSPEDIKAEVWMYAVCHWLPARWREALVTLKHLLVVDKITSVFWNFFDVISIAKKRNHPDAAWLEPLAMVCTGTADPSTLDAWQAWKEAK